MDFEIRHDILSQMYNIVEENVKYYKEDFACYDVPRIVESWDYFDTMYWFIRPSGTHLLLQYPHSDLKADNKIIKTFANFNLKMYIYNKGEECMHEVNIVDYL